MRILFDANTPAQLARFLGRHEIVKAHELGWQALANGALLNAAEEAGFDLLLTFDQTIHYEQNFTNRRLALLVLSTNHWPTLRVVGPKIAAAVDFVQTGQIVRLEVATI